MIHISDVSAAAPFALLSKPQRCGCQWWPTFAALAGLPTHDATGPTPTDGIDQSDYIMGKTAVSPRTETVLDHLMHCVPGPGIDPEQCVAGQTPDFPAGHYPSHAAGALMKAEGDKLYKLIVGPAQQATWYGHWPTSELCTALSSPPQTLSEQVATCAQTAPTASCRRTRPSSHAGPPPASSSATTRLRPCASQEER